MALTKIKISSLQAPGANAGTVLTVQSNQSIAANVSVSGTGAAGESFNPFFLSGM
jgi:hypothetical protein